MITVSLSPVFNDQQFSDQYGNPLSGGLIYTYEAGSTSVLATTYSDISGTPNTNPIVLNSSGRLPSSIWLDSTISYNLVLTDSNNTVISAVDNVISDINTFNSNLWTTNDIVITSNYTLASTKNAVTAGPITVNPGVTITIPSTSTWTVV